MLLINLTTEIRHPVITDGKTKDSVNIQPRSKCRIADGWSVCPDWNSRNPNQIRSIDDSVVQAEKARIAAAVLALHSTPPEPEMVEIEETPAN